MNRPDTVYVIYNCTDKEVVSNRLGFTIIKLHEAVNEVHRLKALYPNREYELLTYHINTFNDIKVKNAAVNILAVEYLIKTDNYSEYSRQVTKLSKLSDTDLICLDVTLSLNMHIDNLGAMITQEDYEHQKELLFKFLEEVELDDSRADQRDS